MPSLPKIPAEMLVHYSRDKHTELKPLTYDELLKEKTAQDPIDTPLNEKELRILGKLQHQPSIILAHPTGTGKSRTAIQVSKQLGLPTEVLLPASLQDNYRKELLKWRGNANPDDVDIQSQQTVARSGLQNNNLAQTMVVDEVHGARNLDTKLLHELKNSKAIRKILLTATPVYNTAYSVAPLVNLAANREVLPEDPKEFRNEYIDRKTINPSLWGRLVGAKPATEDNLKNTEQLKKILNKYIDYEDPARNDYPSSTEEYVNVPMGKGQTDIYNTILDDAPAWVKYKVKAGLPASKQELAKLRSFLYGLREVSNTTEGFVPEGQEVSPKMDSAAAFLANKLKDNKDYKAVVYSNFINSGIREYEKRLKALDIPYGEFSGHMSREARNQAVLDYNNDKIKALMISSAGAQGLDLKKTRLLQILEPYFNEDLETQVKGRAIRYKSHIGLPEQDRNVLIQHYLSTPRKSFLQKMLRAKTKGSDEYIRNIAERKEHLNNQIYDLIRS